MLQQYEALLQGLRGRFAARIQIFLQGTKLGARVLGADGIQSQEPFQGASVILLQVLAELLEHRCLHRMRPILATHESRRDRDQRQRAHLRRDRGGVQGEQPSQRPPQPDRRRRARQDFGNRGFEGQRGLVFAAVAMPGQIHQVHAEAIG